MAGAHATTVITEINAVDFSNPTLIELEARDSLGELYTYELLFSTDESTQDIESKLGRQMSVRSYADGSSIEHHYHGYIVELSQEGWTDQGREIYRATLKPWTWMLTQTNDCKIFQDQTVPEILQTIFSDNGFNDYEINLFETYESRTYCVQYRESDFNFISRLMQEEGIYYYFQHSENSHKMIITDSSTNHRPLSQSLIKYYPPTENVVREEMCFVGWNENRQVRTGCATLNAYDFEKPRASLLSRNFVPRDHDFSDYEQYDYPGKYTKVENGERYARVCAEIKHATAQTFDGIGNVIDVAPGYTFTLSDHPVQKLNSDYLIIETRHSLKIESDHSHKKGAATLSTGVRCIRDEVTFRNLPTARKGQVRGPQTAIVVGPSGDEIHTDKYGRIKVQFFWDRYGKKNEDSSCWIRVAQNWAGAGWGAQFIPRIGQEVMVEFLEGDPDSPLVTGRLYNADNLPAYSLPENKTQSGVKSRSSPGANAGNFNEIRMEDKKGSEELYIHAEKDEKILVKNCKSERVEVDETVYIGRNRTETIGKKLVIDVGDEVILRTGDASIIMKKDGSITIKGSTLNLQSSGKISAKAAIEVNVKGGIINLN